MFIFAFILFLSFLPASVDKVSPTYFRVRLNHATTHYHHPPSAKIYLPPPITNHNHPPPDKIYQPPSTTTYRQPKYIHLHPPQSKIYPSKKVLYTKNINIFYSEVNDEKKFDELVSNTLFQYFPTFFKRNPFMGTFSSYLTAM